MTPEEFVAVVQGYRKQQAREYEREAWVLANIFSAFRGKGKPAVSVDNILSPQVRALLRSGPPSPPDDE